MAHSGKEQGKVLSQQIENLKKDICFKYYDNPALDKKNQYWLLRKDGKVIEEFLDPVLQAMNA